MNDIYRSKVPLDIKETLDRVLVDEMELSGQTSLEILRSDRVQLVAQFTLEEIVSQPNSLMSQLHASHFIGVEIGNRLKQQR